MICIKQSILAIRLHQSSKSCPVHCITSNPPIDMNVTNQHHHSHFIKIYKLATSVFLPIPYYQQVSESTTICAAVFVK